MGSPEDGHTPAPAPALLRSNARVVEEETESWEIEDVSLEDEDDTCSVTNGPDPGEVVLLVRQAMSIMMQIIVLLEQRNDQSASATATHAARDEHVDRDEQDCNRRRLE